MTSCRVCQRFYHLTPEISFTQFIHQEASVFLKKRATLEEEYGRGLQKLARQTSEVYAMSDGKAG